MPIAAIATIADIVSLTGENRNIVKKGLQSFDKLPTGLKQLFKDNKVSIKEPNATDIAFKVAPKSILLDVWDVRKIVWCFI